MDVVGDAGTKDSSSGGDAGGCSGEAYDCPWGSCLDGPIAQCVNGVWFCPAPPSDCGGSSFACGDKTCGPSEYCQVAGGGPPPPPDSGPAVGYSCLELPDACANARSCSCVQEWAGCGTYGTVVQCTQSGGAVTIECAFP